MRMRKKWISLLGVAFAGLTALCATAADDPPKPEGGSLVVLDSAGKEQKLKTWKITAGTRRLGWLAPTEKDPEPDKGKDAPKAPAKGKQATGPEALEFREENSTNFKEGILTLVPLERVRTLEYDNTKQTVSLTVATGLKEDDVATLTGNTKFQGINKLIIEAEVDKGDLGVAEVKFLGGVAKGGINGIKFPATKVGAMPPGRPAFITTKKDSTGQSEHRVSDLQPLYRVGGQETLSLMLFFKKTLKIDVAKIGKIVVPEAGKEPAWTVTLKAGGDETLTLITSPMLDGKQAVLEGFVGRVPLGYKLFPLHVLEEVQFDEKAKKFDAE